MVPAAVLTQSKPVSNTVVRHVSAVVPKFMVTQPRLTHPIVTKSKSPIRRNITRSPSPKSSNSPSRVTDAQAPVVSAAQGDAAFDEKEHDAEKPESIVNLSLSRSALSGEKDDMTKKKDKGKVLLNTSQNIEI
nr:hypothetical protein [Tanacetum cinerariifolium]